MDTQRELTDAEVLDVLRKDEREWWDRWTPEPVPPCRVCGGALSIARCGGGCATEWACSLNEVDPDRPGHCRLKAGRGENEFGEQGHYSRSCWTQHRGGDSAGLESLRRLAAERIARREAAMAERERIIVELLAEADACEAEARAKFRPHQDGPDQQTVGVLIVQAQHARMIAERLRGVPAGPTPPPTGGRDDD